MGVGVGGEFGEARRPAAAEQPSNLFGVIAAALEIAVLVVTIEPPPAAGAKVSSTSVRNSGS